jgi:putative ABC transport system permease protein
MSALALALRQLARNRRRSSIALGTIVFGVVALLLAGGFIEWVLWAMREAAIQSQLGHVQVVRPGYLSAGVADPFSYLLPDDAPELAVIEGLPEVKVVAPRIRFNGLVSRGDTTLSFMGDGVAPDREVEFSKGLRFLEGEELGAADPDEVTLGRGLAETLGARPGDTVILLANAPNGGINAVELRVAGIFRTANKAYDESALRVPLKAANALLRRPGVHSWMILLHDTDQTDAVTATLRALYPEATAKLEFVPWYARADFYNKTVLLFSQQMLVVRTIIGLIIVLSISNLLIMSVLERTGEIGTLLAIGVRRRKVLQLFCTEGAMLGVIGAVVGVIIGVLLAEAISAIGIPMPPAPGMERGYMGEIRLTGALVLNAALVAVLTTSAAAMYPAWKASRMEIVNALRHNR